MKNATNCGMSFLAKVIYSAFCRTAQLASESGH